MNNIQQQPIVAMHNPLGFTDLFSGLNQHDNSKPASFDNLLDAWLANDLTQAGLLPPKEEVTSPFLVDSPNNESVSDCSHDSTPASSAASVMDAVPYSDPFVALFPDIGMSSAVISPPLTPAAANIKPAAPKAIAPRLANIAPKPPTPIAPRPSSSPLVLPDTSRFTTPSTGKRSRETTRPGTCSSSSSSISSGSDDMDEIALKRQKNTDAARRSRLKKLVKMECLEKNVTELEAENSKLNTRVAVLESEKNGLEAKERSLEERVRSLEAQLAEAHKALTSIKH
ncbi:hypothetical protein NQZ79_g6734 [Umbelopsis isabellina]|nr:hypothetical protein NQZ79_g6734 [Umbelopsis isabellina]